MTARLPGSWNARVASWVPLLLVFALLLAAPAILSDFRLGLLGKFLTFAILALALNLIWGYAGMLSLGHGVFFGLGGYAMGMFMKLEASGGKLPDFMFWSGLEQLPFFLAPFKHAWFALPMVFILPAALAGSLGYLVFRSRITGVYFALITQALALIVSILFIGQQPYTGGTNGITNYSTVFGYLGVWTQHPARVLLHNGGGARLDLPAAPGCSGIAVRPGNDRHAG